MNEVYLYSYSKYNFTNDSKRQLEKMKDYCKEKDLKIKNLYCDMGGHREDFFYMLGRIKDGDCNKILVTNKQKLGRILLHFLKKYNCDVEVV